MNIRWLLIPNWTGDDETGGWDETRQLQFWNGTEWEDVPSVEAGSKEQNDPPNMAKHDL